MKLNIIIASIRDGRFGPNLAEVVATVAQEHGGFSEVNLVDLKKWDFSNNLEAVSPAKQDYEREKSKEWAKEVESADAFIIVLPEYNHGYPGGLKDALDYAYHEWAHKPVMFAAYGGKEGWRSSQNLLPVLHWLALVPIRDSVRVNPWNDFDDGGKPKDVDKINSQANKGLDILASYAKALQTVRQVIN